MSFKQGRLFCLYANALIRNRVSPLSTFARLSRSCRAKCESRVLAVSGEQLSQPEVLTGMGFQVR